MSHKLPVVLKKCFDCNECNEIQILITIIILAIVPQGSERKIENFLGLTQHLHHGQSELNGSVTVLHLLPALH